MAWGVVEDRPYFWNLSDEEQSILNQLIGESRERHSSENAFSRATKPSPESAPDSGLSEKRASYDQSLSGGNAFSEASSHSDHSGFSGGSAEGISQEQSFSEVSAQ